MKLELSQEDLSQMPSSLSTGLINWLRYQHPKPIPFSKTSTTNHVEQLQLKLVDPVKPREHTPKHPHIRLSELLDAGITKAGMSVRVRIKGDVAKETGHRYIMKNLKISAKGTVIYNGQEFDKPSPLVKAIHGSSANGWDYVEVKKNGQWVCLNELRQIWRKAS